MPLLQRDVTVKAHSRLNKEQKKVLKQSGIPLQLLTEERLFDIAQHPLHVKEITEDELVEFLRIANALYRGGYQLISDADYDSRYLKELRDRNPNHQFLQVVEPEAAFEGPKVDLPVPMLSTKKGKIKDIERWVDTIKDTADKIGLSVDTLQVRVTPKLDGFAAYDDGNILYTRGDGRRGTDISRAFKRGLDVIGGIRGKGAGEIVVDREYFEKNLSQYFENTRNFQSTIIREEKLEPYVEEAIKDKAVVFYPFVEMDSWVGPLDTLIQDFSSIIDKLWKSVKYDVDGVVLEVTDPQLKKYMDLDLSLNKPYHSWQIAYKIDPEKAEVKVLSIIPQTSRNGRVTPVALLEPTKLSGVTISRATAHHYGMVKKKGIGNGAIIELIRSGMVIPKIERVLKEADPEIPKNCPSCNANLVWDADNLICPNVGDCPAQIINTVEHFFITLRNINGFGSATIEKLFENGVRDVCRIYKLRIDDFKNYGFGDKQSQNLVAELERSRTEPIEDWRFLAAFGVHQLGRANSEQLLKRVKLDDVFKVKVDDLVSRKIFATKTATIFVEGLKAIRKEFDCLINCGFMIEHSKLLSELRAEGTLSPIAGKQVVFTGTMKHGSREQMAREARLLGAKVGSAVTGRTDYLVTGEDVGQKKIDTAKQKNVDVITEAEYLKFIKMHQ
ncbi:MAG TPA: DNA ligase [Nitrospiraceae bacterium]|nr:MAG: DNA ligase [Nitrospirae bacterium GWD2_57_8]HAS54357.1 DNA ligase [Nitrospiraceae bacterium]